MTRRLTAVLAALLLAVGALVAPAHADETVIFRSAGGNVTDKATGDARVGVAVVAPGGVTAVSVKLRMEGQSEPYGRAELKLTSGSATDGSWVTAGTVRLPRGRTLLDAEAVTASGDRVGRDGVGFVDHTPVVLSGSDGTPGELFDGPLKPRLVVRTALPVARVEARYHRAGESAPAFTVDAFTETSRLRFQDHHEITLEATRPVDPPTGDYWLGFTVWNDAGDRYERRVSFTGAPSVRKREKAEFADLKVTPSTTDVEAPETEFTGRLVTAADRAPLRGLEIDVNGATITTGPDGGFRTRIVTTNALQPTASFAGNGRYGRARGVLPAPFQRQATEVSAAFSPTPTTVGQRVKITGTLKRRARGGAWVPLAGRKIVARGVTTGTETAATTAGNGTYTITVVAGRDRRWDVEAPYQDGDYAYARRMLPASGPLPLKYVTAFEKPDFGHARVNRTGGITVSAHLTYRTESGASGPVVNAPVRLQFSADGKTWKDVGDRATTYVDGSFMINAPVAGTGYWRFRYAGDATRTTAQSPARRIVAKYRTELLGADRSLNKRKLTISGRLQRHVNGPKPAAKGAKVTLYFRAEGSTKWKAVATTTTDSRGRFSRTVTASKDGDWRSGFAETASYWGCYGRVMYVDIR
ncbi:hypothetical protein GCM10009678_07170 [Actinomadura kijaniata]|uniref:Uncharacterized protein n=1 Tax=Actinomadura namibiensis TaxID=182080 RepID=A0A7W3LLG3_ACTNM|nr:hypothetical protein [Actinomadura namibiensis]MBA8950317.1 hypothetical protein [Actinomadura namibiensis]